MNMKSPRE